MDKHGVTIPRWPPGHAELIRYERGGTTDPLREILKAGREGFLPREEDPSSSLMPTLEARRNSGISKPFGPGRINHYYSSYR